jgi:hypothetical protein
LSSQRYKEFFKTLLEYHQINHLSTLTQARELLYTDSVVVDGTSVSSSLRASNAPVILRNCSFFSLNDFSKLRSSSRISVAL